MAPPPGLDGLSMVPELTGHGEQEQHDYLYWEFPAQGGKQAVRMGDWKALRLDVHQNPDAPLELYNLKDDPGEEHDVSGQHPEIVEQMRAHMKEAHIPNEIFPLFD